MKHKSAQQSQFVYGKFTGGNHPYDVIAYTHDLENHRKDLKDLVEGNSSYRFWGNRLPDNPVAVGICQNKTNILSNKDFLIIHSAQATDGKNFLVSGSRPFIQHQLIFGDKKIYDLFKIQAGLLLRKLGAEKIPYFEIQPTDDSWSSLSENFFECEVDFEEKCKKAVFIMRQKNAFIKEALQIILSEKRLLLTPTQQEQDPLEVLDMILLWLPAAYRQTLSIVAGSIDENDCKWADIIIKYNGTPGNRNNEDLIWLNNQSNITALSNTKIEHSYINNFLDYPETTLDDSLAILSYLNECEQYFDLAKPSIEFILDFPIELKFREIRMISIMTQYWDEIKFELVLWIDQLDANKFTRDYKIFEKLFKNKFENYSIENHIFVYIKKMLKILQVSRSGEIICFLQDKLFDTEKNLMAILSLEILNLLTDSDVINVVEEKCYIFLKTISNFSKAVKFIDDCLDSNKIFIGAEKRFKLLTSVLNGYEFSTDEFQHQLNKIIVLLPQVEIKAFRTSNLQLYLNSQDEYKNINTSINFLLSSNKDPEYVKQLPMIADGLKMPLSLVKKLYRIFVITWKPNFQQALPLIHSCIEKSTCEFRINPNLFQDIFIEIKPESTQILNIASNINIGNNLWNDWQQLIRILYGNDYHHKQEAILFLDRLLISQEKPHFCGQVVKLFLELSLGGFDENQAKELFASSHAWKFIDEKSLKVIASQYREWLPYLIDLSKDQEINPSRIDVLIDYSLEIMLSELQSKTDKKLWNILQSTILSSVENSKKYWMKLAEIWLYAFSVLDDTPDLKKPVHQITNNEKEDLSQLVVKTISDLRQSNKIEKLLTYSSYFGLHESSIQIFCSINIKCFTSQLLIKYSQLLINNLNSKNTSKSPIEKKRAVDDLRDFFQFYKHITMNQDFIELQKSDLDESIIRALFTFIYQINI